MRAAPVLFALALALPPSLGAQEPATGKVYVAGGVELSRVLRYPGSYATEYAPDLGLSLQAGYVRQIRRLGLRLGVAYYERNRQSNICGGIDYPACDPSTEFSHLANSRTFGLSFDLTYDVTRSGVRPYVIAGLGWYRASVVSRDTYASNTYNGTYVQRDVAFLPGVGVRLPLSEAEAFAELRYHVHSGQSYVRMPMTVGLRF